MPPHSIDQRLEELRRRAEAMLGRPPRVKDLQDALSLAQELSVHQVELEIQNEELRSTQEELGTARELYHKLFDLAPVGFLVLDGDWVIQEANVAAQAMLGFGMTQRPSLGSRLLQWASVDGLSALSEHLVSATRARGSQVVSGEVAFIRGGETVMVEMHSVALRQVKHSGVLLSALVDITERKRQEKEARQSREEAALERARLRTLFDHSPIGLILAEAPSGDVVMQNPEAANIGGNMSGEEMPAGEYGDFARLEDEEGRGLAPDEYPLGRALHQGEITSRQRFISRSVSGERRMLSISAAPVRDENGFIRAAIANILDVTQEEQNRRELESLQRDLESLVAQRTAELEGKTISLAETNTALKVLLNSREQERQVQEEAILSNINRLALPLIDRLALSETPETTNALLDSLRNILKDLTSGFSQRLTSSQYQLSARELEVAGLIKDGNTSDEISEILCISTSAVLFHRNNIRKKLGLKGKKVRLASHLRFVS